MAGINLSQKISESTQFSEDGVLIEQGEYFFTTRRHGRTVKLTQSEGERLLGLRDFSADKRKELAKTGAAMKDGSYPIENCSDAKNARKLIGRGSASHAAIVAHIKKREKALGCNNGPL